MSTKLWYGRYIDDWIHALPLGNGRLGAMFYGNPHGEIIEINEESLWSGRQIKEKNHATPADLQKIRKLIFEDRLREAAQLSRETFLADPPRVRFYESFGEILVDFSDRSECTDYRKELELSEAVASAFWKKGSTAYVSECFVSEAYDALCYRVKTNGEPFSCTVTVKRKQDAYTAAVANDLLVLNGRTTYSLHPQYGDGGEGMSFGARIRVRSDGSLQEHHDCIAVSDATCLEIYGAFATNYNVETFDIDEGKDYRAALTACLDRLAGVDFETVKAAHLRDHAAWFSTVSFELEGVDYTGEPTDVRLAKVKSGEREDPDLCTLYYQFGRYLLIESSGKNATLPANLQGIWCNGFRPPWGADYHTNINLQMNYWLAETANCSGAVKPLTHFMKMLSRFGRQTAQEEFGAEGWCINHTTDVFGRTGVHDSVDCGFFPMAGPWMCLSLWEHYEFTSDKEYLKEIYPILAGSCRFLLDYLTEAPDGYLTTSPSNSPENSFYYTEPDGTRHCSMLTQGATIDFEIIYALFTRTAYACGLLGDTAFADELHAVLKRLPPLRVSERYGILCEWIEDYEEVEPGHRHVSPLFGLYPADQINEADPVIYEAARKTLTRRLTFGGEGGAGCHNVGWSQAWMINFFARFKDGDAAFERVQGLLRNCTADNLFDFLPPQLFQIDGNFGGTAGITEMLVQSHLGTPDDRVVELLPALPAAWPTGTVRGIRTRGGFTVDMAWRDGKLTEATVLASESRNLRLKLPTYGETVQVPVTAYSLKAGEAVTLRFDNENTRKEKIP